MVLLHKSKMLDDRILDRAAPQHAHIHVVWILEQIATTCRQRGYSAQRAKLGGKLATQGREFCCGGSSVTVAV